MCSQLIYVYAANADLLAKLVERHARFVIVGAVAARFYLPERQADNLDLLIDPVPENTKLVIDAINFGAPHIYQLEPSMLEKAKVQWSIKNYYYADILTPDVAVDFECVWMNSIEAKVAYRPSPIQVRIAAIADLIAMLGSSKEEKHKRDIESLGKLSDGQ